jgi:hypothetical protein
MLARCASLLAIAGSAVAFAPMMSMDTSRREIVQVRRMQASTNKTAFRTIGIRRHCPDAFLLHVDDILMRVQAGAATAVAAPLLRSKPAEASNFRPGFPGFAPVRQQWHTCTKNLASFSSTDVS